VSAAEELLHSLELHTSAVGYAGQKSENLRILGVAVKNMIRAAGKVDTPAGADELRALANERGIEVVEVVELHQPC
jgi:hypothetical protein